MKDKISIAFGFEIREKIGLNFDFSAVDVKDCAIARGIG